ncbi:MAG: hypothetical protein HZB41_02685 [Ignavibacteriae bacterium]|nr:hypothetical protein [Ignavibacteriota bacterium]
MKKFLVVFLFLFMSTIHVFSQNFAIDKGAMIIGGTAGFTSEGSEGSSDRTNVLYLNPVFDYFIVQNLFIGGSISLVASEGTIFSIGPEIGYAFGSV